MNKLAVSAFIVFALNACNSPEGKHTEHGTSDSSHENMDHSQDHSSGEMKQLMDGMMTRMHQQKSTGNNDIDYANMMLQHHQAAVDMAKLQISKGKDDSLKSFSQQVIDAQQKEIALMAEFISRGNPQRSANSAAFKKAINETMDIMMTPQVPVHNDIDKDFVEQMIPHHQAAVDMAKVYLQFGTDASLKKMSNDIIASQSSEIEWLKGKL